VSAPPAGVATPADWPEVAALHREAAARGESEVQLHAQVCARRFYQRAGYTAVGEECEEVGTRHVTMRRTLGSGSAGPA
jgi:predicted GNAT family N-acyltransferase